MEEDAVEYCRSGFDRGYADEHIRVGCLPYGIPFDEAFDTVVALDVIEHVRDDEAALSEIWKKVAWGGTCC